MAMQCRWSKQCRGACRWSVSDDEVSMLGYRVRVRNSIGPSAPVLVPKALVFVVPKASVVVVVFVVARL
eukprot:2795363-Rhodomonas_salina.2